jgi:hypothetical protein
MKAKKNKINGISFIRKTDDVDGKPQHEITLHLEGKIPAMGYGCRELIILLQEYDKLYTER